MKQGRHIGNAYLVSVFVQRCRVFVTALEQGGQLPAPCRVCANRFENRRLPGRVLAPEQGDLAKLGHAQALDAPEARDRQAGKVQPVGCGSCGQSRITSRMSGQGVVVQRHHRPPGGDVAALATVWVRRLWRVAYPARTVAPRTIYGLGVTISSRRRRAGSDAAVQRRGGRYSTTVPFASTTPTGMRAMSPTKRTPGRWPRGRRGDG